MARGLFRYAIDSCRRLARSVLSRRSLPSDSRCIVVVVVAFALAILRDGCCVQFFEYSRCSTLLLLLLLLALSRRRQCCDFFSMRVIFAASPHQIEVGEILCVARCVVAFGARTVTRPNSPLLPKTWPRRRASPYLSSRPSS